MGVDVSIETLMYKNYIRYDRMYQLVMNTFTGSTDEIVDIYIDMNSCLSSLYKQNIEIANTTCISSSMINLCAHIREYFWSRHRVWTNIFIVYGDNFPNKQRAINPLYNQRNYDNWVTHSQLNEIIDQNIQIMKLLCPYLPDIYFIHKYEEETAVLMKHIMSGTLNYRCSKGMYPNIIFTKDPHVYQLISLEPRTFIFRPSKSSKEDSSWAITKNNFYPTYMVKDLKNNMTGEFSENKISPQLYSLVLSIAGLKSRNINSIAQFKSTIRMLSSAVRDGYILDKYTSDINFILNMLIDCKASRGIPIMQNWNTIVNNFNQIDVMQNLMSPEDVATYIDSKILNLHDPEAIKQINNQYFINNPLDLGGL